MLNRLVSPNSSSFCFSQSLPNKRLNAVVAGGAAVTAVLALGGGMMGTAAYIWSQSKEAQVFLDTNGQEAFVSKLASFETRDLSSNLKRSGKSGLIMPAAFLATSIAGLGGYGVYKVVQKLFGKEGEHLTSSPTLLNLLVTRISLLLFFHSFPVAQDFLLSKDGEAFVSKLASLEKREKGEEELLKLLGF